jgi:3-hydroxybutyryl-CoA dehydrogenase
VLKEKISETRKHEILCNVFLTLDVEDAKDANIVIEAASEKLEIKQMIFEKLDSIMDYATIFATNTSSLSIAQIGSSTHRLDKFIGVHFFNPANVMKLVEVICSLETSNETYLYMEQFVKSLQKEPIKVKESPGFVVNRSLIPMINEAIGVLSEGVASAEDIDQAMMLGANHPIGPLALSDLVGNDITLAIMESLHLQLQDDKYKPHPLLVEMVQLNKLGRKTKQGFYPY